MLLRLHVKLFPIVVEIILYHLKEIKYETYIYFNIFNYGESIKTKQKTN